MIMYHRYIKFLFASEHQFIIRVNDDDSRQWTDNSTANVTHLLSVTHADGIALNY